MTRDSAPETSLELERIVFFTDAVTAIVATILVIELRLPELAAPELAAQLFDVLLTMGPKLASYALSFFVIGSFWMRHHSMFSHIRRYDYRLIWLNILYLLFLALIPFATAVLGASLFASLAIMLYSGIMSITAFLHAAVWEYASRGNRLIDQETPKEVLRYERWRPLMSALAFLSAIPLTFIIGPFGVVAWILVPVSFVGYRRVTDVRK
ncbi:MAG: TMEM175 family protein [Candidatus Thorarchaeota archaeon]